MYLKQFGMLIYMAMHCTGMRYSDLLKADFNKRNVSACYGSVDNILTIQCGFGQRISILGLVYGLKNDKHCPLERAYRNRDQSCCIPEKEDCFASFEINSFLAQKERCYNRQNCMFQATRIIKPHTCLDVNDKLVTQFVVGFYLCVTEAPSTAVTPQPASTTTIGINSTTSAEVTFVSSRTANSTLAREEFDNDIVPIIGGTVGGIFLVIIGAVFLGVTRQTWAQKCKRTTEVKQKVQFTLSKNSTEIHDAPDPNSLYETLDEYAITSNEQEQQHKLNEGRSSFVNENPPFKPSVKFKTAGIGFCTHVTHMKDGNRTKWARNISPASNGIKNIAECERSKQEYSQDNDNNEAEIVNCKKCAFRCAHLPQKPKSTSCRCEDVHLGHSKTDESIIDTGVNKSVNSGPHYYVLDENSSEYCLANNILDIERPSDVKSTKECDGYSHIAGIENVGTPDSKGYIHVPLSKCESGKHGEYNHLRHFHHRHVFPHVDSQYTHTVLPSVVSDNYGYAYCVDDKEQN